MVFVFLSISKNKFAGWQKQPHLFFLVIYANPVRPGFDGTVKISEGGTIEWDTGAFGEYKVASGVYMIFISTDDARIQR